MSIKKIDDLHGKTKAFAIACYDTNSIAELKSPHSPGDADPVDLKQWEITPEEWSTAISVALQEKLEDI